MRLDQSSSCGAISAGSPIISAMTIAGHRRGKGLEQLDLAVALEAVDQLVGQHLDARPQLLDVARHEGAVDQRAEPRVRRRLERQQRVFFGLVERRDVRPWAAAMPSSSRLVTCRICRPNRLSRSRRVDVLEAGKAPVAVVLPEEGRALRMERVVERIGVADRTPASRGLARGAAVGGSRVKGGVSSTGA